MEHNRVAWLLIRFSVQFRKQVPHTATFIHLRGENLRGRAVSVRRGESKRIMVEGDPECFSPYRWDLVVSKFELRDWRPCDERYGLAQLLHRTLVTLTTYLSGANAGGRQPTFFGARL